MKFAKWVFAIAGIYGILVTAPLYFYEAQIAVQMPPALTHPEYYYGFIGVTLAFQFVFLIIAREPLHYRLFMLPSIFEKFSYALAILVLTLQSRAPALIIVFAAIDFFLGVLFVISFYLTRGREWQ
ncbi:MAG TPA: hypothetical protein VFD70_20350 [Anaerolineae bacterium]|nr:hypothetical protein [Anaerolineae bacterium]